MKPNCEGCFVKKIILAVLCTVMAVVALIPMLMLLQLAFNPPDLVSGEGRFALHIPTLVNFRDALEQSNLPRAMFNSLIITVSSLVLTVIFSACASYEIDRFPFWLNRFSYGLFLFSMAVPSIISTVPLYILMRSFGAINTYWGMILLNTASCLPFSIFYIQVLSGQPPREMEEAALIDGCSWFGGFWRIVFPVLKPVTSTVILLNAVTFWNEYGRSVFFLQKQSRYTMPLAISMFIQKYSAQWNLMAAASVIALIPTVAVFLSFQKYFVKGLAAGAVKG